MALTCSNVGAAVTNTSSDTFTIASFTLTQNRLGLLVINAVDNADMSTPTFGGTLGATWVLAAEEETAATQMHTWVFRALDTGSDQTGTIIVTFPDGSVFTMGGYVDEWDGVDTGGTNGSAAIVQSVSATSATGTALAAGTLSAFGSANNGMYVVGASGLVAGAPTLTKAAADTETAQFNESGGPSTTDQGCASAYLIGEDTTPTYTSDTDTDWNCIGFEIAAAATTGTGNPFSISNADLLRGKMG